MTKEGGVIMEVTKYLCEFFFSNFWHFLELIIVLAIVFKMSLFTINYKGKKD